MENAPRLPWDRRPDEGPEAFEAFAAYRDFGLGRSIRAVAQELGKSSTLLGRWSRRHEWQSRVRAWDADTDRSAQAGYREGAADEARGRAKLLSKQVEMLGAPGVELARRLEVDQTALHEIDTPELIQLAARAARPLVTLLQAERDFLESHGDAVAKADLGWIEGLSRAQLEEFLIGLDDGLG